MRNRLKSLYLNTYDKEISKSTVIRKLMTNQSALETIPVGCAALHPPYKPVSAV
jgi:hypothetical protein